MTYIEDNPDEPGVRCLTMELILSAAMLNMCYKVFFQENLQMNNGGIGVELMLFLKGNWRRRFCGEIPSFQMPRLRVETLVCRA